MSQINMFLLCQPEKNYLRHKKCNKKKIMQKTYGELSITCHHFEFYCVVVGRFNKKKVILIPYVYSLPDFDQTF